MIQKCLRMANLLIGGFILIPSAFADSEPLTRAESTHYTETSTYSDVLTFLREIQIRSDWVRVTRLATSSEGRMIPLVVLSQESLTDPAQLAMLQKPVVLILANIHAGEVEGKESTLMLIRDITAKRINGILEHQVLLFIPIYNVDGNDKLGRNRRDNGPELAGLRPNGQNLDLNRDYMKLEAPETQGLLSVIRRWDPVLTIDMHTTNGSYHREPVTYTGMAHPSTSGALQNYLWQKLYPTAAGTLKKSYGYESVPYGNFIDRLQPGQGWLNDAIEARYGTNYIGLRNRFAVLDENYSYADFKTRVLASYAFVRSILEYTDRHIREMADLVLQTDLDTAGNYYRQAAVLDFKVETLMNITVQSYEFVKEARPANTGVPAPPGAGPFIMRRTDTFRDYFMPYLSKAVPGRVRALPAEGYVILPGQAEVIANLKAHGISLEKFLESCTMTETENFKISTLEMSKTIYQGRIALTIRGEYEKREVAFPENAYFVSLKQPLARLIPILLEPEIPDSLAAWGFFNRAIVQQWSNAFSLYPVYRVSRRPPVPMLVES